MATLVFAIGEQNQVADHRVMRKAVEFFQPRLRPRHRHHMRAGFCQSARGGIAEEARLAPRQQAAPAPVGPPATAATGIRTAVIYNPTATAQTAILYNQGVAQQTLTVQPGNLTVHASPGVYALLLGSGVSTGVGVPTGRLPARDRDFVADPRHSCGHPR